MSTLLFIRHAETDLAGTFCGRTNPPINQAGQKQIQQLTESLRESGLEAVITSDLLRAHTTAQSIACDLNLPVSVEADLREIDFGSWDGLSWKQIEQRDAAFASRWINEYPRLTPPDGEDFQHFRHRVLTAVSHVQSDFMTQHVAVVTHGGVMRVVLQELCGKSDQEAWALTNSYCCSFSYTASIVPREVQR